MGGTKTLTDVIVFKVYFIFYDNIHCTIYKKHVNIENVYKRHSHLFITNSIHWYYKKKTGQILQCSFQVQNSLYK